MATKETSTSIQSARLHQRAHRGRSCRPGSLSSKARRPTTRSSSTRFGGEYQELLVVTGTSSQDYAKIRASKGAPGFDVAAALSPPEVLLGAKEGLLEKITDKEVPNLKYTWEKARQTLPPVTVIHTLQFDSLLYNKDKLDKPDSWADYWQPEKRYGAKVKGHVINYNREPAPSTR
jgi:spermidine/putrescine-binding protein